MPVRDRHCPSSSPLPLVRETVGSSPCMMVRVSPLLRVQYQTPPRRATLAVTHIYLILVATSQLKSSTLVPQLPQTRSSAGSADRKLASNDGKAPRRDRRGAYLFPFLEIGRAHV